MEDLSKLLKDAKRGLKLYSPLFGEVTFGYVSAGNTIWVTSSNGKTMLMFTRNGKYCLNFHGKDDIDESAECLLFPSKDCRTWEGWKAPVKPKFKVGDEIFRPARNEYFKVKGIEKDNGIVWYVTTRTRIADNDKRMGEVVRINTFYQNEYSIASKSHYDITNFHAGMPVLQRDENDECWNFDYFGRYIDDNRSHPFVLVGRSSRQCIPFEGNEHLLGTTDMCGEEYINW